MSLIRIAVLVSGGGTNLQALIDAQNENALGACEIALVISSGHNAFALERAMQNGIKTDVISKKEYKTAEALNTALLGALTENKIDLVVLAGYLPIIGKKVLEAFRSKIINIHPSLIPSFCGEGFYGIKVHEAALKYGVKITGATVHYVTEVIDGGDIIMQKAVEVRDGDTPESLQTRVMEEAERLLLPKAVKLICDEITASTDQ